MFNTLAQYFLGTSNNSNNLDPGSKPNHQEVPTNNVDHQQQQHVEQALAQQNAFQVYPNKRGRARRNRKNKVSGPGDAVAKVKGGRPGATHQVAGDSPATTCGSPDFLLHGITTRVCEEEDEEWLFVECAQANKKGGIITLHDDLVEITCLPEEADALEPPKPRFEIKHNPLNLNQQQLKRQLRQQNAALISCEDIEDDEELMRMAASANGERRAGQEEIQVIDPEQSAVVEGDSVDVEVPPVAVELPEEEAQQQQRQAHGDEEPRIDRQQKTAAMAMPKRPMEESWFVTPPSCFTSQGPVQMETSPLENLLIEHPSMSVYHHGVRNMERSADIEESLVVLEKEREEDREDVKMDDQQAESLPTAERTPVHTDKVANDDDDEYDSDDDEQLEGTAPAVRSERPFDYVCNREAKQGLLFRNAQMNHDKKMRQKLCRNAMTRSNKTSEINATKNGPKKRSEKQHAKNASRANNNRKSQ